MSEYVKRVSNQIRLRQRIKSFHLGKSSFVGLIAVDAFEKCILKRIYWIRIRLVHLVNKWHVCVWNVSLRNTTKCLQIARVIICKTRRNKQNRQSDKQQQKRFSRSTKLTHFPSNASNHWLASSACEHFFFYTSSWYRQFQPSIRCGINKAMCIRSFAFVCNTSGCSFVRSTLVKLCN